MVILRSNIVKRVSIEVRYKKALVISVPAVRSGKAYET
jgi:hypothetical protein